jgi:hypothetical protein
VQVGRWPIDEQKLLAANRAKVAKKTLKLKEGEANDGAPASCCNRQPAPRDLIGEFRLGEYGDFLLYRRTGTYD